LGDKLIVGVSTDAVMEKYKPGKMVMAFEDRFKIVESIKHVDVCIPQSDRDKYNTWEKIKYDILAVGDDWKGSPEFAFFEKKLESVGVKTVYLPYTGSISSTKLRKRLNTE